MQREEMGIVNGNVNKHGRGMGMGGNGSLKGIPAHLYFKVI